jgi:hypothetical protein
MCDLPPVKGSVHDVPQYIRVNPGWVEKALLCALLTQIFLSLFFLFKGSLPANHLAEEAKITRQMHCEVLKVRNIQVYEEFVQLRYCS